MNKYFKIIISLAFVLVFFSCERNTKFYNSLYYQGKEEKNVKLLKKGFEIADPFFSELCAIELCNMLPKQKAVDLAKKAINLYPESGKMWELYVSLLYEQRDYENLISWVEGKQLFSEEQSEYQLEIQRFYLSALVKTEDKLSQETSNKIAQWFKNHSFTVSHSRFYRDFSEQIDFNPIIKARYYKYIGSYGKAVSFLEDSYETRNEFEKAILSLSFDELFEIGDAFVSGTSEKSKYGEIFSACGLGFDQKEKAFYALFSSGRLYEKAGGEYLYKALESFRSAIYFAPEASFDRALWYYIRCSTNFSLVAGKNAFIEYSRLWKDSEYFDDVVETFSAKLLSSYQFEGYFNLFSEIYPFLSQASQGKTDYIFGTLIEAGLLRFGDSTLAREYYEKAYFNVESPGYYKILAGVKLGVNFENYGKVVESEEILTKVPEESLENEYFAYLIEKEPENITTYYYENPDKLSLELIKKAGFKLEEMAKRDFNYYPRALALFVDAFEKDDKLLFQNKEQLKCLYPRYFRKDVEEVSKEFDVPEYVLYSLIRGESFFDYDIVSSAGAIGLCQLMPSTAGDVGKKLKYKEYDLADAKTNITFGGYYLGNLASRLDNNVLMAIFSYNAGITKVRNWRKGNSSVPLDVFLEMIPYEETRNYGRKLVKGAVIYGYLYYGLSPDEVVKILGLY